MISLSAVRALIKKQDVLIYFGLTLIISWGGFLLVIGPGGFANTNWEKEQSFIYAIMVMLLGPSISGLLLTGLLDGRMGYSRIISEIGVWRVNAKWYAFALLPAPLLSIVSLAALSIDSPITTSSNKIVVLLSGITAGLTTILEEIGWTGFAVPRLRQRFSVLKTGLLVGVMWGVWHLLQQLFISRSYAGEIPLTIYLFAAFFNTIAGLTAYRILLVWIYDRTESLLMTTLMHASLTACNIFIFRPETTGVSFLKFSFLFTALQWVLVASVAFAFAERKKALN